MDSKLKRNIVYNAITQLIIVLVPFAENNILLTLNCICEKSMNYKRVYLRFSILAFDEETIVILYPFFT